MTITTMQGFDGCHQTSKHPQDRLMAIAPKYISPSASIPSQKRSTAVNIMTQIPRTRLPPRSRFGCWTCRNRKVKCDEGRPRCSPCVRLGHSCDYNPRLAFKDDTPRVVAKMQHSKNLRDMARDAARFAPSIEGHSVQDPADDLLPAFSALTNDEDREKKAEYRAPGTYNIIVNPSSFSELEEYKAVDEDPIGSSKLPMRSMPQRQESINSNPSQSSSEGFSDDPDVVILSKFEDDTRNLLSTYTHNPRYIGSATPTPSNDSCESASHQLEIGCAPSETTSSPTFVEILYQDGVDHRIITHLNNFMQRSFAQVQRDSLGVLFGNDKGSAHQIIAQQAIGYPPLKHALLALATLSMKQGDGPQSFTALQHYQQAIPSLKERLNTSEDMLSDGAMLTHFMLLLYEIAASEPRGSNLWSYHMDRLLRIVLSRHELYGSERYSFVIWWTCVIDAHAVLTGGSDGEYVDKMIKMKLLPATNNPLRQSGALVSVSHFPEDSMQTPSILEFHRMITLQAARLGLLRKDLWREAARCDGRVMAPDDLRYRQQRVKQNRDLLMQIWNAHSETVGRSNDRLPAGDRGMFEHTYALYHACLVYSYTTMYSSQLLESASTPHPELFQSIRKILDLGREIVDNGHLERKFMVFPLFMAGFASDHPSDKEEAMNLLVALEKESMGKVARASRELLEIVYRRQDEELSRAGHALNVDWVQVLIETGLQVVNCRL